MDNGTNSWVVIERATESFLRAGEDDGCVSGRAGYGRRSLRLNPRCIAGDARATEPACERYDTAIRARAEEAGRRPAPDVMVPPNMYVHPLAKSARVGYCDGVHIARRGGAPVGRASGGGRKDGRRGSGVERSDCGESAARATVADGGRRDGVECDRARRLRWRQRQKDTDAGTADGAERNRDDRINDSPDGKPGGLAARVAGGVAQGVAGCLAQGVAGCLAGCLAEGVPDPLGRVADRRLAARSASPALTTRSMAREQPGLEAGLLIGRCVPASDLMAGAQFARGFAIAPGASATLTWTFVDPGAFQFACHAPEHDDKGMVQDTVTVTP